MFFEEDEEEEEWKQQQQQQQNNNNIINNSCTRKRDGYNSGVILIQLMTNPWGWIKGFFIQNTSSQHGQH